MRTHLKIILASTALILCIALVCISAGCKQDSTADSEQEEEEEEELTGEQEEEGEEEEPAGEQEEEEEPEPAFEDTVLAELQNYHGVSPQEIYSPAVLDNMLDFAGDNESLISDYENRHFYILTEFLKDNADATEHAVAVDQYVREIDDMIFDYCGIDLDNRIEGYDDVPYEDDIYVRDAINLNWSNFVEAEKKGELINSIDSRKINFLPYSIFMLDMQKRVDATSSRFGGNEIYKNREMQIEVAYYNITNFWQRHDETWHIATHLDEPIKSEVNTYTPEFIILNNIEGVASNLGWFNSAEQARRDVELLFENGSNTVRTWMTIYANARLQNRGHDENAVEGGIADLWTIGMSAYRVSGTSSVNHGELAGSLTQNDKDLLMGVSDDELFIEPGTQTMTTLWTRKNMAIEDGMVRARLILPNGEVINFYP